MEEMKKEENKEGQSTIVKTKISDEMNKFDVYGSVFNLPSRYEVTKPLGSGAYGWVVQSKDLKKGVDIAIK